MSAWEPGSALVWEPVLDWGSGQVSGQVSVRELVPESVPELVSVLEPVSASVLVLLRRRSQPWSRKW